MVNSNDEQQEQRVVRMKVITVANRKGGTAKTTTVVNLAYGFAQAGKRVMVIDLDNQGHVMHGLKALGCAPQNEVTELPISHFFTSILKCSENIYATDVDTNKANTNDNVTLDTLRNWCDSDCVTRHFDVVLIDTPPTLSPQLMAALSAATDIVIPATPLPLATDGVQKLLTACRNAMAQQKFRATTLTILPVMVEQNLKLHRQQLSEWYERYGRSKVLVPIRKSIKLAEAFAQNKPVFAYAPNSRGAHDYTELCKQLIG
ncbi:ParA family protein [Alteromonas mediterranea]|nr:ParA family protein [Alteromonas mediterranea]CAH1208759.1 Chromosome-partitioning ATPase Soj [Alteromonas mediterranea]